MTFVAVVAVGLYEAFLGAIKAIFGVDIDFFLDATRESIEGFYNLVSGFPPIFLELAGFALAGILVGIIIRLL